MYWILRVKFWSFQLNVVKGVTWRLQTCQRRGVQSLGHWPELPHVMRSNGLWSSAGARLSPSQKLWFADASPRPPVSKLDVSSENVLSAKDLSVLPRVGPTLWQCGATWTHQPPENATNFVRLFFFRVPRNSVSNNNWGCKLSIFKGAGIHCWSCRVL